MERIFVVGMGVVSSIGMNIEENLFSLRNGKTGIAPIKYLESIHRSEFVVGEIPYSDEELRELINQLFSIPTKIYNRSTLISIIAIKEALKKAGIKDNSDVKTAFISGNTLGGISLTEKHYQNYLVVNPKIFTHLSASGESTETIAKNIGGIDFCTTINTACSSSSNAIIYGAQLIKTGRIKRAIVGGVDTLTKFSLNGFNSLLLLDNSLCKPFDKNRNGLNLGEGAGYLVLEPESEVKKRNHKPIAELVSYCNANDTYHQTASSPDGDGAVLTMNGALKNAGLSANEISFVHTHGTATENNDLSEGKALERVFENVPPFISTKSYIGHTLGGAGAINAIYTILGIVNKQIFPTINFKDPIPELKIKPVDSLINNYEINYAMSNAFGFGGNNASLIFSKIRHHN